MATIRNAGDGRVLSRLIGGSVVLQNVGVLPHDYMAL